MLPLQVVVASMTSIPPSESDYSRSILDYQNTTNAVCCNGSGGLSVGHRILGISVSFMCFCVLFLLTWSLLSSYYQRFTTVSYALQSDMCSRAVSVVHSIIIVPSLISGIAAMKWGEHYEPLGDVAFLQGMLCISLGYFLYDTILLLIYQSPQWLGFVVHHVVASIPYITYMFVDSCSFGLFILASFMLVEATNLPLHVRATLEENDMGHTMLYAAALYTTFVGWIVFRLINPTFLLVVIHAYVIPSLPVGALKCILPGVICAYLINIFCYAVFVLILCKEVLLRWRCSPKLGEVASADSTRPVELDVMNMSIDEQNIVGECPTRLLMYETQENIRGRLERSGLMRRAVLSASIVSHH